MKIISIAIQKGGSGKTTTSINLAAAMKQLGKKVLLIDLDPQANLSQALGFEEPEKKEEPEWISIYSLLKDEFDGEASDVQGAIRSAHGLDLIPSSLDLASAEMEMISLFGREKILKTMLEAVDGQYDFVLIDCPPSIGLLTVNALTASQYVLMPLQAEFLPLKGLEGFMRSFKKIKRQINPELEILGFVLTRYDSRKKMNRSILDQLLDTYGHWVLESSIRSNIALAQAQEQGMDIFTYDRTAKGAYDYLQLAKEVLEKV